MSAENIIRQVRSCASDQPSFTDDAGLHRNVNESGMAISLTWCHALSARVTRVTDLEGNVECSVCPYYEEASRACSLCTDAASGGPLAQLPERVAGDALTNRHAVRACLPA